MNTEPNLSVPLSARVPEAGRVQLCDTADSKSALPRSELAERFVTLCDGRRGLRSGLHAEVCEAPATTPEEPRAGETPSSATPQPPATLDFIASDETLDRYDEIIVPSGWKLDNYRRNPVFQNAHQYGDIIFTLGRALITEVRTVGGRPALFQRLEFATQVNPLARIAYGLYKGKFLNAVSVGFIPLRWENGSAEAGFGRKYLEQELLEVSAVGIPANPNALTLGLQAGAIQKCDLQDLLDLLEGLRSSMNPPIHPSINPFAGFGSLLAAPNTLASASGVRSNEAQWLQLARALKEVMRET